jgi:exonuclease SbcC
MGRERSIADRVVAATGHLEGARDDAARARSDLEETNLRLEEMLGPGDPADLLAERKRVYEALLTARDGAQRKVEHLRSDHDQAIRDEQNTARSLHDLRMRLADLAAGLTSDIDLGDDPESLGAAHDILRREWSDATGALHRELAELEHEADRIGAEQSALLGAASVGDDVNAAVAVVADRMERLGKSIAEDEAELARADELAASRESIESQISVFGRINRDLTDSRFIRFLLDDERDRLAELGSEHFQRLSAGRYRFADDQFAILDLTAADGTRRPDSLSGGETFLASLGLALALAEMVAGTGGRLDAFFLDEGFGTLDPEHLDLAMEGVETLVADQADRLVVIVSHVPELRERIEDLIELERNPVTGDTRVVTG